MGEAELKTVLLVSILLDLMRFRLELYTEAGRDGGLGGGFNGVNQWETCLKRRLLLNG